jgi:hypothetical protein
MMDKDQLTAYLEVRKTLIERLRRLEFTGTMLDQLDKLSTFQLVGLLWLMAAHCGYLPGYVMAVRTLEELFGDIIYDKPGQDEPPKVEEPKPSVVH